MLLVLLAQHTGLCALESCISNVGVGLLGEAVGDLYIAQMPTSLWKI